MTQPGTGPDDSARLLSLLELHQSALADFTALVGELDGEEWELPTDLAGWSVHDLVSHTAHLEAVLAGAPEETIQISEPPPHVGSLASVYTEQGVLARRARTRGELIEEIEAAAARRLSETRANPPRDGSARPPKTPGDVPWSWSTLLSNRPLDVWMHEQDIRRAVGRPGHLDSVAGRHVVGVFAGGLGFVLAKLAGASIGQTAAVALSEGRTFAATVGDDGRGRTAGSDAVPDTTLRMSTESFVILSGGRRPAETQHVEIHGDHDLGERVLRSMAVTP